MSKDSYNFDEVNSEGPTILMGGFTYKLTYPTVEDIEKIQALKTDEARANAVYGFVTKTVDTDPEFQELLKTQSIKVLLAFTEMIKAEFGVE